MSELEHLFDDKSLLNEAKTRLLTALEKKFGKDKLYSTDMNFQFDTKNVIQIFDTLNSVVFNNRLNKIKIIIDSMDNIRKMVLERTGFATTANYYAIYFPEVNDDCRLVRESILISNDNLNMTMLFAINMVCHEMIHMFDFHYGDIKQIVRSRRYRSGMEHHTNTFTKFLANLNQEGLKIMIDGGNTPFDILNHEVVQATIDLRESEEDFKDLVRRLRAGEKFSYCGITPRGTIAFLIS